MLSTNLNHLETLPHKSLITMETLDNDRDTEDAVKLKRLSTTVFGMKEKPQPAVILVLSNKANESHVTELVTELEKLKISAFLERSTEHVFVCLFLSDKSCEELAEKTGYNVKIETHKAGDNSSSGVWTNSSSGVWTKFSSLYHYGSLSYNCFTEVSYWIRFNRLFRSKLEPRSLESLYSVRVQSEIIYDILRTEEILERTEPEIQGNFVPHTPQASKLIRNMSWFPPFFPLEEFRDYFGEELAFVYAWSNFWWTFGLIPLAVVALISLIYGLSTYQHDIESHAGHENETNWEKFQHILVNSSTSYYLGFMMIWIAVFQFKWENVSPVLSIQWGVASFHKEEPCFKSSSRFRYLARLPNLLISLIGILLAGSLTIVLFIVVEVIIRRELRRDDKVELKYTNLICTLIYSLLNTVAGNVVIPAIAQFLTDLENHKFRSIHINSIIFKYTGYYLVSSYFYLTFQVLDFHTYLYNRYHVDDKTVTVDSTHRVKHETIEITQQLLIQIMMLRLRGVVISFLAWCWSKIKRSRRTKPGSSDLSYILQNYKSSQLLDTSVCSMWMSERVIMYGYLTMFSYHVPIAAIIALIIEVFVTSYELQMLVRSQRPQPRRVGDIRQWEGIIYLINIISIIVNSYSLSKKAEESTGDCVHDYGEEGCDVADHQLALFFMPVFIIVTSLIEIQDAVSGDFVQEHLQRQYKESLDLVSGLIGPE